MEATAGMLPRSGLNLSPSMYHNTVPSNGTSPPDKAAAVAAAAVAHRGINGTYPYHSQAATAETLVHGYQPNISTTSPVPKPLSYTTPGYHGLISSASSMLPAQSYPSPLVDFTSNLTPSRFPFYTHDVPGAYPPTAAGFFDPHMTMPMGLGRYDMDNMTAITGDPSSTGEARTLGRYDRDSMTVISDDSSNTGEIEDHPIMCCPYA